MRTQLRRDGHCQPARSIDRVPNLTLMGGAMGPGRLEKDEVRWKSDRLASGHGLILGLGSDAGGGGRGPGHSCATLLPAPAMEEGSNGCCEKVLDFADLRLSDD